MPTPMSKEGNDRPTWPALPYADWKAARDTLHMWAQIVGKVRLEQTPWQNHSWHVPLYVTARGLTTSTIPHGERIFEIEFDFLDHLLRINTGEGMTRTMPLAPRSVADFYRQFMAELAELGLPVRIRTRPNEVLDAIPFDQDEVHASYDPDAANRFWRILAQSERVFRQFRSGFVGKASPIHLFWGALDLASTRFSGKTAPSHPGGIPNCPDWVTREAYSHEVSSCGFWPGAEPMPEPVFYAYAYPEPPGFKAAPVRPAEARYDTAFGEFVLPYDAVRRAPAPDAALLEFLETTYAAAADLGKWDRAALERTPGRPR
jgi:hypothetical protein